MPISDSRSNIDFLIFDKNMELNVLFNLLTGLFEQLLRRASLLESENAQLRQILTLMNLGLGQVPTLQLENYQLRKSLSRWIPKL